MNTLAPQISPSLSLPHERMPIVGETYSYTLCNPYVEKAPVLASANQSSSKISSFRMPPLSPAKLFVPIGKKTPLPNDMNLHCSQTSRRKDSNFQSKNELQERNLTVRGRSVAEKRGDVEQKQGRQRGVGSSLDVAEFKQLSNKLDSIQSRIAQMRHELEQKNKRKARRSAKKIKNEKAKSCVTLGPVNCSVIENEEVKLIEAQSSSPEKQALLAHIVTQVPRHQSYQIYSSRSNPRQKYYLSELLQAYKEEKSLARAHLVSSLNILKTLERRHKCSEAEIQFKKMDLPYRKGFEGRKTIIFDLDETLIHCSQPKKKRFADVLLSVQLSSRQIVQVGINIRPYIWELLSELVKHFELMVFTASHRSYADAVIDYIDPQQQFFHHRLYREHCTMTPQDVYIKDLRIINRPLQNMLLVDNAAYSYAWQLKNGVPILPYYQGQNDLELKMLKDYLISLLGTEQIVEANGDYFKLHRYKEYLSTPNKLVETLYSQNYQLR